MDKRTEKAFLGKARHNLKNPVNAILGYSEMLIEDCEDEGLDHLISDIDKLHQAGSEILKSIEEIFNDKALNDPDRSISSIAEEMEMALRTPLNTIIGYSELLLDESESVGIENFSSDINKITESGRMLENELSTIIDFDSDDIKGIRKQNLNLGNLSMVKDVMDSIVPLDKNDKKSIEVGNILVVDDNKNNTDLLDKRLSKKGHTVTSANNGKEALLRLKIDRNGFDVVLLDIVMPEMNGYEVLKYIKNDKRFFEIPVIMISSMDDTDSIYRCIEIGADDYITKPFEKSILDARITSCIEKKHLRDKEKRLMQELAEEQEKSENLLLNILPKEIAERLKAGETDIATKHDDITMLFADIVNFTPQSKELKPNKLIVILNQIFSSFDDISSKYDIEKIKTIGDSYFAVGGLNSESSQAANNIIEMAKEMILSTNNINNTTPEMDIQIRIGIHAGSVVTGVIGKHKFAYDLWGAAVNMASRMESTSKPGKIHISERVKSLADGEFDYQERRDIEVKGVGVINSYFVE